MCLMRFRLFLHRFISRVLIFANSVLCCNFFFERHLPKNFKIFAKSKKFCFMKESFDTDCPTKLYIFNTIFTLIDITDLPLSVKQNNIGIQDRKLLKNG